ncbi:MAG: cupin domain-containing protein [Hyphomonadaceae bacterium]|nr:cupin domain-containing protein [Hyphomonadaceae bacterium]
MITPTTTAADLITALRMKPHPEGGHYVETFRDEIVDGRARSTAIYFLLQAGEASHWHKVDAVEFWLWHAGAPLALSVAYDNALPFTLTMGPDVLGGQYPQVVVPAGAWQAARIQSDAAGGDWTLVSCVVAPGFRFAGFTLAPPGWEPPSPA